MAFHSSISPGDRIPFPQKIAFALACNVDHLVVGLTISTLWLPYFNIGCGINPGILGVVLMILRGWDAFLDPAVGNFSDNARTRWGRRHPFMVVGAIATALLYPLLWRLPAEASPSAQIPILIVMGLLVFTAFSVWSMPYYAMQLELTPSYDERTRLMSWIALSIKLATFASGWILAIATSRLFAHPNGEPDLVHGVQMCTLFVAALILCLGLLPPLFVKERYYAAEAAHQKKEPLWQSIKESVRCRPLLQLIGISFILILGGASQAGLAQYANIYFVFHGDLKASAMVMGWKSTIVLTAGVLSIPFWVWLSEKLDKQIVVASLLGAAIFGHLMNIFCLRPDMPYLQLVPAAFEASVIAAIWLFLPSMKGDVADYDEVYTFRRREGSLNAFYSWSTKMASTLALGLGGFLLVSTGFDVHQHAQSPEVLGRLRMTFLIVPVAIWSLGFVMLWFYPLNRRRMADIRKSLEERRGSI